MAVCADPQTRLLPIMDPTTPDNGLGSLSNLYSGPGIAEYITILDNRDAVIRN